jgi:AraC-like DNA-binding protein
MPKPTRTDASQRTSIVVDALAADLARPWTVADMAEVLGVTSSQLRRIFASSETTPRQVLTALRLDAAARLLSDPALRIKEIPARVGLADTSHFCRDFRRRFGMSPTEYRGRANAAANPANKSANAPIDSRAHAD